ncbi:hypothetical protein TorRG33x02_011060 [Trema orientale]|uniref:Uncharacterized protein n=1 Tax=Trema orientale TaxID=63057 RepID=A0A2P5FZ31_TREOI|nr:hypothetical protein TorRG33x02_011060 [Trema orientale]
MAFTKANLYKNIPLINGAFCAIVSLLRSSRATRRLEKKCFIDKASGWQNEHTQEKYAEMVTSKVKTLTQTQAHTQYEPVDIASSAESVVGSE